MIRAFEVCNGSKKTETQIDYFVRIKAESITLCLDRNGFFSICNTSYSLDMRECLACQMMLFRYPRRLLVCISATLLCYFCIQRIPRLGRMYCINFYANASYFHIYATGSIVLYSWDIHAKRFSIFPYIFALAITYIFRILSALLSHATGC